MNSGASAPEMLVRGVLDRLGERFEVTLREIDATPETVTFKLPKAVA